MTSTKRYALIAAAILLAAGGIFRPAQGATPGDPAAAEKARRLIAVLQSGAGTFERARACQQLADLGDKAAVPALAALLGDETLAAYARSGLESIADPSAGDALRAALGRLHSKLLAGVVNSLGVRRDAKAVGSLARLARDPTSGVAEEALAALGRIDSDEACEIVREAMRSDRAAIRAAAAEAILGCAHRLSRAGGAEMGGDVLLQLSHQKGTPKHVRVAAMQGAVQDLLSREAWQGAGRNAGRNLFTEQLKGSDRDMFDMAIRLSYRLPEHWVKQSLLGWMDGLPPERRVLVIVALGNRGDATARLSVEGAALEGPPEVRLAAVRALGRLGSASEVGFLLGAAAAPDARLAEAARASLAMLRGKDVEAALVAYVDQGSADGRIAVLDVLGRRAFASAAPAVLKAADDPRPPVRRAAIRAMGQIGRLEDLPASTLCLRNSKTPEDTAVAEEALTTACARTPDREKCALAVLEADFLAAKKALHSRPLDAAFKAGLMGRIGGHLALETVSGFAHSSDPHLQDAATRALGDWATADAAPVLLDLAKTLPDGKLRTRALRGYLRIARQMDMPAAQRRAMCQEALRTAQRDEERKMARDLLRQIP